MRTIDVCVIGAGPAGLTAAATAARYGLGTVVLDERPAPGGQIYNGVTKGPFGTGSVLGPDYVRGRSIVADCLASGATVESGATVSRIDPGGEITYICDGRLERLHCTRTILATGAIERTVPFEGWTLPGVMTAGAAQLLLKGSGVVPSGSIILAGNGPLLLLLATQYLTLGVRPTAILDTGGGSAARLAAARHAWGALRNAPLLTKGLGLVAAIWRSGIPVLDAVTGLAAVGTDSIDHVRFVHKGLERALAVDTLLIHEGVVPNVQVTVALGCRHAWDELQQSLRPETDAWGETSVDGVFAVGDCAGISGAIAAGHAGRLAGLRAAFQLGRLDDLELESEAASARRGLARERGARPFLDALFAPQSSAEASIDDDVIVCRCEEVRASDIRQAVLDGARGLRQLKAFTRSGMGPCQGRICGGTVARIIAEMTQVSPAEIGTYNARFPLKPLTLEQMAAQTDEMEDA